ncbi:MAG: phosphate-starvation-inducible PsiE family protein [Thermoanaerobaculia bacterium]
MRKDDAETEGLTRSQAPGSEARAREWLSRQFTRVEDVVYAGLGILLAAVALVLLVASAIAFAQSFGEGALPRNVVGLLDRMLLILMVVEILYTVQVSFRSHVLTPEPFLIVGLIAATRRILVLTAEFPDILEKGETPFRHAMVELGLLTLLIVALVGSLRLLRQRPSEAAATNT